jgi:osmotically-inducible protein OsmY
MSESRSCLLERLEEALASSPHLFGRKLGYEAEAGIVVLRGTVTSYFQKQMAQEAIRRIDGVELIDNQLEVAWN